MIVVPVYMFSALLDGVIFNSIQFWSGDNPITASEMENDGLTKVARFGDVTVRWTSTSEGAAVTCECYGGIERRATIVSSAAGYRLVDERGTTLAEAIIYSRWHRHFPQSWLSGRAAVDWGSTAIDCSGPWRNPGRV